MKVSLPQRNKLAQSMLWNLFLLTVGAVFFCIDILPLLTSFVFSFTLKVSSLRKPMTFS